jgi:hypothetical protein
MFFSHGEGKMSRVNWTFVAYENNCEVADILTLLQLYLFFVHSVMDLFNISIKQVKSNYMWITEIHSAIGNLKNEFVNRQENFYGFQVL